MSGPRATEGGRVPPKVYPCGTWMLPVACERSTPPQGYSRRRQGRRLAPRPPSVSRVTLSMHPTAHPNGIYNRQ